MYDIIYVLKTNCKFGALDVKKEVIKLIDLHIHTTNSDGTDTPIQILKLAEEIQVLREDVKFEYNTFNNVDDLLKSLKDDSKE